MKILAYFICHKFVIATYNSKYVNFFKLSNDGRIYEIIAVVYKIQINYFLNLANKKKYCSVLR